MYKPVLLLFLFLLINGFNKTIAQSQKIENSLFWEISGKGIKKTSYLFGTYHVLNDSYLNDIPNVKKAFENAEGIVVETVLDSSKMQEVMMGMMLSSKKVSELITEEEFKRVDEEVKQTMGGSLTLMDQFKPVFITFMLTLAYNEQENKEFLGKYTGVPLDLYLASTAKKNGKTVLSFETIEEQLTLLFKHDTEEEQAKQLVEFVNTKEDMKGAMKSLTTLYVNEDLKGMYEIYKKYAKQFGEAAYLLEDRNLKWIKELPSMLQEGNKFIAVGALHFTGDKGLIKLLREAGYSVKPLLTK